MVGKTSHHMAPALGDNSVAPYMVCKLGTSSVDSSVVHNGPGAVKRHVVNGCKICMPFSASFLAPGFADSLCVTTGLYK